MKVAYVIVKIHYGDFDVYKEEIVGIALSESSADELSFKLNSKRSEVDIENEVSYAVRRTKIYP